MISAKIRKFIEDNQMLLDSDLQEFIELFPASSKSFTVKECEEFLNIMLTAFEEFRTAYNDWTNKLSKSTNDLYDKYPNTAMLKGWKTPSLVISEKYIIPYLNGNYVVIETQTDDTKTGTLTNRNIRADFEVVHHAPHDKLNQDFDIISFCSDDNRYRTTDQFPQLPFIVIKNFTEFFTHTQLDEYISLFDNFLKTVNDKIDKCIASYEWENKAIQIAPYISDLIMSTCNTFLTNCHVEYQREYNTSICWYVTSDEFPNKTSSASVILNFTRQDPDKVNWNKEMINLKNRIKRKQKTLIK